MGIVVVQSKYRAGDVQGNGASLVSFGGAVVTICLISGFMNARRRDYSRRSCMLLTDRSYVPIYENDVALRCLC